MHAGERLPGFLLQVRWLPSRPPSPPPGMHSARSPAAPVVSTHGPPCRLLSAHPAETTVGPDGPPTPNHLSQLPLLPTPNHLRMVKPYKHYIPFWKKVPEEILDALDWAYVRPCSALTLGPPALPAPSQPDPLQLAPPLSALQPLQP